MLRTYEFYEKYFNLPEYVVNKIAEIIKNIEHGIYNEDEIRSLGADVLKFCICEGKYELFKKLVGPFAFKTRDGSIKYKYLLDAFTLGLVEFINGCPSSIMEHWALENDKLRSDFNKISEEHIHIPVEVTIRDAVVLYPSLKEELLSSIYTLDKEKIMNIRIKDVLARQISGMGHPIRCARDVIYYCEAPVIYSSLDLFDKNIITTANDTQGCYDDGANLPACVFLNVDYDSLDEGNKLVADSLVEMGKADIQEKSFVGNGKGIIIKVPCDRNDTIYVVNQELMKIVSMFHKQDMVYGRVSVDDIYTAFCNHYLYLTEEEKEKVYSILEDGYTSENILRALEYFKFLDYYYDEKEDVFWDSEYYYRKHIKFLEEQPGYGKI